MDLLTIDNVVAALIAIIAFYLSCLPTVKYWQRKGVNGPKVYPILGTLLGEVFTSSSVLQEQRYKKYGRIYGTMQFWRPVITIAEPELVKQIKITDFRIFMNHRRVLQQMPPISKMLAELMDDEWKRVRSIISPVFSSGKLKAMIPLINRSIINTLENCKHIANEKKEVDLKKVAMSYTLDTIATCAFGVKLNGHRDPNQEFIRKGLQIIDIKPWRFIFSKILPQWMQIKLDLEFLSRDLNNYFASLLKSVIEDRRRVNVRRVDFVNLLLEAELKTNETNGSIESSSSSAKNRLTDEEIIGNCMMFFLAGYETTATLLQYTMFLLALNPKVQQKLFEEIRTYYEKYQTFEYDSLMDLPYLDAVINESLRYYTPIITFEHVCSEDYKLGDTGITIDKGTIVTIPYYSIHHDPENFPEPYKFMPERFLPENRENIKPYTFLPFGTGPRNCIAMRFAFLTAKLFIANLINQFKILKSKNTPAKPEFNGSFLFLTCKPLYATFQCRS